MKDTVQIVIAIPEDFYKTIKEDSYGVYQGRIYDMIKDGTLLPKGHGKLVDADKLKDKLREETCGDCFDAKMIVNDAPAVIEADKNRKESNSYMVEI